MTGNLNMNMNIIASSSASWGIGSGSSLLFRIKEDMRYFKEKTTGNVVVMGRKTLDSLPGGEPLPDRVNIVLTRNKSFSREGVTAVHSLDELFDELKKYDCAVYVIGGGEIYRTLLPYCGRAYITRINAEREADVFLPDLDRDEKWQKTIHGETQTSRTGLEYSFDVYERIK